MTHLLDALLGVIGGVFWLLLLLIYPLALLGWCVGKLWMVEGERMAEGDWRDFTRWWFMEQWDGA